LLFYFLEILLKIWYN